MTSVKALRKGRTLASWLLIVAIMASMLLTTAVAVDVPEITFVNTGEGKDIISLTDQRSFEAVLTLNSEISADKVTWTLSREKGSQDETLFPYQYLGGALEDWTMWDGEEPFFTGIKTEEGTVDGSPALKLSFSTEYFFGVNRMDAPRNNRNVILDYTGDFVLACLDADGNVLGQAAVRVSPYDDYRTNSELALDIAAAKTASIGVSGLYVELMSLGTSTQGYDIPYVVISDSEASIDNYLELTERALRDPEGVLADIQSGKISDYRIPVFFSNIHPDETPGADAPMNVIWDIIDSFGTGGKITYNILTGFTTEGEKQLKAEMEAEGIQWSELVKDYVTGLGFIKGENTTSGVVDIAKYYTVEEYTLDVNALLDNIILIVCPTENVDGRTNDVRQNGNGFDINRDNMFQTQTETQLMTQAIAKWNPATFVELHGFVGTYQVEPCSPPHEPNFEYDLFAELGLKSGEAFGVSAVANNSEFNSYVMPLRDYLVTDDNGDPYWAEPWDDMSTNYTPQYSMLHGSVAFTIEVPKANQEATTSLEYGLLNHAAFVSEYKKEFYVNQLTGWVRGVNNIDEESIRDWYVDMNDNIGAEADAFRPKYEGNDNFFPECYIIPLDGENQTNLRAAYEMQAFLFRNGVVMHTLNQDVTIDGVTYLTGSMVVSMYQAKRNVANGALYDGVLITGWTDLYSEPITAFGQMRGFDCYAIDTVGAVTNNMLTEITAVSNGTTYFTGVRGGEVIIDNDSLNAISMVNSMLDRGVKVGFITDGEYKGGFVVSYDDFLSYEAIVVKATGVEKAPKAQVLKNADIYIPGYAGDFSVDSGGNEYGVLNYPNYGNTNYNFDRFAYGKQMGFNIVSDPAKADVIVGNRAADSAALAAIKSGTPYLAAGSGTLSVIKDELLGEYGFDYVSSGTIQDALYFVEYNTESLTTASYAKRGDNLVYSYGGAYISSVPAGASVLMTATNDTPLEGFMMAENLANYLGSVQAISYNKNGLDITVFAGSLTNKAHQQDDYQFAANTIFSKTMGADYITGFTDISNTWSYEYVVYTYVEGLFNGTSATTFSPNVTMTRGMLVTVLWRLDGSPSPEGTVSFSDLSKDWYRDAVLWAAENEIVQGRGLTEKDGETVPYFAPDAPVTREEMAVILYRYNEYKGNAAASGADLSAFSDAGNISKWASEGIDYAVAAGLINGMNDGSLSPKGSATRAQVATILQRYLTANVTP